MSRAAGPASAPPADQPAGRRRWMPFWLLQVMELVVALILVDVSVHVDNSGLLVAAALAFALLAVTANGPLGIVRICRPRLHLTLVVAVAAVVALAPLLPAARPDIEGIIVIEFGAIGMIRLATLTDLNPSSRRSKARQADGRVIEATAAVVEDVTPRAAAPDQAATAPTSTTGAAGAAARRLGRATGVASVSGRQAVAKHRPEAEKQVKRAIRGAGRISGRLASAAEPAQPAGPAGPSAAPAGD